MHNLTSNKYVPLLSQSDDSKLFSFPRFDPFYALQLWIDHKRPPLAVCEYGGILCTHAVTGQVFVVPLGNRCIVSQQRQWVEVFSDFDGNLEVKTQTFEFSNLRFLN